MVLRLEHAAIPSVAVKVLIAGEVVHVWSFEYLEWCTVYRCNPHVLLYYGFRCYQLPKDNGVEKTLCVVKSQILQESNVRFCKRDLAISNITLIIDPLVVVESRSSDRRIVAGVPKIVE